MFMMYLKNLGKIFKIIQLLGITVKATKMSEISIKFGSASAKKIVTIWQSNHSLDVFETLQNHIEQKFALNSFSIDHATVQDDILMLKLISELWSDGKEFGLTSEGSLIW